MQLLERVNQYLHMDEHVEVAVNIEDSSVMKTTKAWQKLLLVQWDPDIIILDKQYSWYNDENLVDRT